MIVSSLRLSFFFVMVMTESTINIDINISDDEDTAPDRNTTSTVFKADEDNFVKTNNDNIVECDNKTVNIGDELKFGQKEDNVITLQVQIT